MRNLSVGLIGQWENLELVRRYRGKDHTVSRWREPSHCERT